MKNDGGGAEQALPEARVPQRILWMLECWNGHSHQLIPMYALSEENANELAEKHMRESENRLIRVALTAFPGGFVIHRSRLPGGVPQVFAKEAPSHGMTETTS